MPADIHLHGYNLCGLYVYRSYVLGDIVMVVVPFGGDFGGGFGGAFGGSVCGGGGGFGPFNSQTIVRNLF